VTIERTGTFSHSSSRMMLARPVAMAGTFSHSNQTERTERTGTFSHSGSRTMLARPVAMVIFDDKQGTRSRRIYWHGVQ
jgi:hypothetical protein